MQTICSHHRRIRSLVQKLYKVYPQRWLSSKTNVEEWRKPFNIQEPDLDMKYLTNPKNSKNIQRNIRNRKGVGDIQVVVDLWKQYQMSGEKDRHEIHRQLLVAAKEIPNSTYHTTPVGDDSKARCVEVIGRKKEFDFKPKTVVNLAENLGILRTQNLTISSGDKSYYFMHDLARLETALVAFTLDRLKKEGFQLISVPDIIHPEIIESCGFKTKGERSQVYKLDSRRHKALCLAGTSEMPIAGYFMDRILRSSDLPKTVTAVSRCFRAETSGLAEEKGIYRVHQFTKVEMFSVTSSASDSSNRQVERFLQIQKQLFSELGLHFRVLDMPTQELGSPASRKYDIEAWMPAKQFWGEISSTSNCLDYQSRRLHIKYESDEGINHVHTVNGTACAVPRLIMAIVENNQEKDGKVALPPCLHSYMESDYLSKPKNSLPIHWIKSKKLKSKT